MTPEILKGLIKEAIASPSVHNVQPARWRIEGDSLVLLEDRSRRLHVGDPTGHDAAISLGAAAEGLGLAASAQGFSTQIERLNGEDQGFGRVARLEFSPGASTDPLHAVLHTRASWRGAFVPIDEAMRAKAASLSGEDRHLVTDPDHIAEIARALDTANYSFMSQSGFRRELTGWMRIKRSHPNWARDGLNADAMQLSAFEARGASLVLGPLFGLLHAIGLARPLLSEKSAFGNAAGVMLFHRPGGEDPFTSGRHFHRAWLMIDAAGFGANVLAALADDPQISAEVAGQAGLPDSRRLVSAFRFGLRGEATFAPARLPLEEVLID